VAERGAETLRGKRLLVVEDDYMIAAELVRALEDQGATVVGPAGSVADALALISTAAALDGGVLDINLGGELIYPVADALRERGTPFVFATGYDAWVIPDQYRDASRCEKPVDVHQLASLLLRGQS
jgi:CheY-like chemotaxis protein